MTAAEPATPRATSAALRFPMVRATWRDVLPLGWRLAVEFTRPTRTTWPFLPSTLLLFPIFVGVAAMPGVFHWKRTAVLGLARQGEGGARRRGVKAYLVILTVAEIGLLVAAFGTGGIVVWTGSLLGAITVPRALGSAARALKPTPTRARSDDGQGTPPLLRRMLSFVHSPPPSTWTASVAAFRPTDGVRAIPGIFVPHIRSTVQPGETIGIVAANPTLAHLYRELGFVQAGASLLQLQATL